MLPDYIIVGAGSAGCVIANRLSADPVCKVLLIEAGGRDSKLEIGIPAAYSALNYSKVNWNFYTEPQPYLYNRKIYQPRGKALGGSSAINCMAYIRGNKQDYNEWERLGCAGWGYEELLPYFIKSENNEQFQNAYHGQGGMLNVRHNQYITPLAEAFLKANVENGVPLNEDFNGERQEGAGKFQFTIKDGKRCSTAVAFLKPILHRPNLQVITGAKVSKVIIKDGRALGVELMKSKTGSVESILAAKEVILSAGAFQSPQILMLSGIGDADYLKKHKIECKENLKGVGQNLSDHLFTNMNVLCSVKDISYNTVLNLKNLLKYFYNTTGPLTSSPLEACSFIKSMEGLTRPDIQFHFSPAWGYDIHDFNGRPKSGGFTLLPTIIRPKSRGYVGLQDSNPFSDPLIDPQYLSDKKGEDMATMVSAFKLAKKVLLSAAFDNYRIGNTLNYPQHSESDEQIMAHIRKVVECVYHPVGTCKMGTDELAVLSPVDLKVKGLDGLRIADGSIMPEVISGNTNATCIAIGERAADMILRE